MLFSEEKPCSKCVFAKRIETDNGKKPLLACGYKCYLNPFKPVFIGLNGKHKFRKSAKEANKNK